MSSTLPDQTGKLCQNFGCDLKIIVVGDVSTGKSSFCGRWINNTFTKTYTPTISSLFTYKIINKNNMFIRVNLWDLTGQDRDFILTKLCCRDCHGVVIVCEVNNKDSQINALRWKEAIKDNIHYKQIDHLPIILVENKSDLLSNEFKLLGIKESETFAKENGFSGFFRTSAQSGENVNESMDFLLNSIINGEIKEKQMFQNEISLVNIETKKESKCC